jgi:uncharacterized protein YcfL
MKSIIPLLAVVVLATFALAGCDQNTPGNSSGSQSTNSSVSGGTNNLSATNSLPNLNTNTQASTKP